MSIKMLPLLIEYAKINTLFGVVNLFDFILLQNLVTNNMLDSGVKIALITAIAAFLNKIIDSFLEIYKIKHKKF